MQLFTTFGLATALILSSGTAHLALPVAHAETVQIAQATPQSSQFVTVDRSHRTTGIARIVTENGQQYLEFDQQFSTARGPDVEVILYRDRTVPAAIDESDYITLAQLQRVRGAQRYAIPDNISLDNYGSVGIWCRTFNITFGYASL